MTILLTERQQEVLALLANFQSEHGYAATYKEIAERMGLAQNAVVLHIRALTRKGMVTINPGKARGIQLAGERSPVQQRDELLAALRDLYACNPGSAERAALLLKRYEDWEVA